MIGSFRARACRANRHGGQHSRQHSRQGWLALLLLVLLANLSVSAATHRHPAPGGAPAVLEQGSGAGSHTPGSPAAGVSLDDVCAICGALAGSAAACTSRMPLDLEALLARSFVSLPQRILSAASGWWVSTASRAPPTFLF